ncbi:hypothetical protein EV702DRAFT_1201637 [Suillus placidus]|uniref:Uncharacterized protein n=1 Tax=Suillus placidus TaxID=48579 RepID=A0A9P6ZNC3_9AGAM|nr:hypothetical protein EV702DRAFT_1201637 [Suillus placidus]
MRDLAERRELSNYGEYSGAPRGGQTFEYAKTILDLLTRPPPHPDGKILTIGGGITIFTNVAEPNKSLSTDVANRCETFDKPTGWYDLCETVLEAVAFGWNPGPNAPPMQWFCVYGGANEIAACMELYIRKNSKDAIAYNPRATAIGVKKDNSGMDVVTDNKDHHEFSHATPTIPLPVLRTIGLCQADPSPMQSNALRTLNYGPSVKIGMQFRTARRMTGTDLSGNPVNIVGG